MFRFEGVAKTKELIEFEKIDHEMIVRFRELARIVVKAVQEIFNALVMVFDEIHEMKTCEKPKLPKTDFTRSRITHQTFDRKPRFAVRKILQ